MEHDRIAIKTYWEKQYLLIKNYNIQTQDDFISFCNEMRKKRNHALLLSIMKYRIEQGEELERLSELDRRVIAQALELDAIMRSWVNSMPVFSFSLLFLIADVCFPRQVDYIFTPITNSFFPKF